MDGIHDLGGKHGHGPVFPDGRRPPEPVFAARWEAVVFAIMRAAGAAGAYRNADQFRHAIERIDPVAYLTHGYYGRWLGGLETLLVEAGLVERAEIDARTGPQGRVAARPSPTPDVVGPPAETGSARRLAAPPRFRVGQVVRTRTAPSPGHTRLPAYARGHRGTVQAWHGGWVFPDSNAHGRGENPQHLYTVAFTGEELWGAAAEAGVRVHIDLFEDYLEA